MNQHNKNIILVNFLAVTTGSQVERARAFLGLMNKINPNLKLHVLKVAGTLSEFDGQDNLVIQNVVIPKIKSLRALHRILWENIYLFEIIANKNINIFLTFSHSLPFLRLRIPSIVGVSNLAPFSLIAKRNLSLVNKIKFYLLKKTIINSCNKATRVLALSAECKRILVENGVNDNKIFIQQNGVDKFWRDIDNSQNIDKKKYILYVSHFYTYKNHRTLIEAYSTLSEDIQNEFPLILIGDPKDTFYYKSVINAIKFYGVEDRVKIYMGLDKIKIRWFYENARLFIFPSVIENSPSILLEAMCAGAPLLVSNIEPMPEHCQGAALYFNPLDPREIALLLERLIRDTDKLIKMRDSSLSQAKHFDWEFFMLKLSNEISLLNSK